MGLSNDLQKIAQSMGVGDAYQQRMDAGNNYKQAFNTRPSISQIRESIMGSDLAKPLKQYQTYEANAAKQLFEEPTQYLTQMSDANSDMFVADPMARLSQANSRQGALMKNLTTIKNEIKKKNGDLDDIINAYADEYDRVIKSKLIDKEEADSLFDMAWQMAQEDYERKKYEEEKTYDRSHTSIGNTAAERLRYEKQQAMIRDVSNGMTLGDAMGKYKDGLDYVDMVDIYDKYSSWGKAKESESDKQKMYQSYVDGKSYDTGKKTINSQIENLGSAAERKGAREALDLLNVIDEAIAKSKDTPTGPISAAKAGLGKWFGKMNSTAKLDPALHEILRTIRKISTGVAFSPQEVKELEKEIPTIYQQETPVAENLYRLKQRALSKLSLYGVDPGEWQDTGEVKEQ